MKINKFCLAICLGFLLLAFSTTHAQTGKIPPFRFLQSNGKIFKAEDLPKGKPVVLIYFSPECDHCELLVTELIKRSAEFKKSSIALITYLPLEKVSKFAVDYHLNKYSNIYVGTERSSYFVRNYYNIIDLPFAALYTKNGDLVKLYPKNVSLNELSMRLGSLR